MKFRKHPHGSLSLAFLIFLAVLPSCDSADSSRDSTDWPHWRGPARNGHTGEISGWKAGKPWPAKAPAWSADVGEGSTSPLVVGDRLYVMGWADGHDRLTCLNSTSGEPVWSLDYPEPQYPRYAKGDQKAYGGPTATPEYDPATGFLYTLGTNGDLFCRDTAKEGREVWRLNLYDAYHVPQRPKTGGGLRDYGYTTAPLVWGKWLLVEVGSEYGTVIAFNKQTGQEVWKSEYHNPAGHTGGMTPLTVDGVPCVAVLTLYDLVVLRLDPGHEGKTVAVFPWKTDWANNILTPTAEGRSVIIGAYHTHQSYCRVDVSLETGATKAWETQVLSHVGSPVIHQERVYIAGRQLSCLDWNSGEILWETGAWGNGGSLIVTGDGKLVVFGGPNNLALFDLNELDPKDPKPLTVREQVLPGDHWDSWPHVALANGRIYCKNRQGRIVAFEVP